MTAAAAPSRLPPPTRLALRHVAATAWIQADRWQHALVARPRLARALRRTGNRAYGLLYRHNLRGDELFEFIQIQTVTGCNLSCQFCPANKSPRLYGGVGSHTHHVMAPATFARIVGELGALEYAGTVQLFLMNEPTLDPLLVERVAQVRAACPAAWVRVSTNGVGVDPTTLQGLCDAGLHELVVDDYTGGKVSARLAAARLRPGATTVRVLQRDRRAPFDPLGHELYNRAGNCTGAGAEALPAPLFCDRPSRFMYLTWQGRAVQCCSDWAFETHLGDVHTDGLLGTWQGERYRALRARLAQGDRDHGICRRCDFGGAQRFRARSRGAPRPHAAPPRRTVERSAAA